MRRARTPRADRGAAPGRWGWPRAHRVVTGAGVAWAVVAYVPGGGLLAAPQAFAAYAGVVGVAVAAAGLVRRDPLAAAVAALASGALVWPTLAPAPRPAPDPAAPSLRVLTLNTQFGQADPGQVLDAVRGRSVDVLVLVEETPEHWAALRRAGLGGLLPYATGRVTTDASGAVIATRTPVTCDGLSDGLSCGRVVNERPREGQGARDGGSRQARMPSVRLPDGTLLAAMHPWAPLPAPRAWGLDQDELIRWRAARPAGERFVIAGDANAGPGHPTFRRFADGLTRTPAGPVAARTWPHAALLGVPVPPLIPLDHVLASGYGLRDEATITIDGTDHLAVYAELAPTPRAPRT